MAMLADKVKQAAGADLRALAEEAGFRPSRGKKFHCALHEDHTPSAHPYPYSVHCFSCGENFDAIDLARMIIGGSSAGEAIHWLAARCGVMQEPGRQPEPRFSELDYPDAELFRIGFCWALENELAELKRPLQETGLIYGRLIFRLTALLAQARAWNPRQATVFYTKLRTRDQRRVRRWMQDALEFQLAIARVIAYAGTGKAKRAA
jgi:hypothetical protein